MRTNNTQSAVAPLLSKNADFLDAINKKDESRVLKIIEQYFSWEIANDNTLLSLAAENNFPNVVRALARKGAKLDSKTPLHCAAEKGFYDVARVTLEEYPKIINNVNDQGATACFLAVKNGHFNILKFLIEKGAQCQVSSSLTENGKLFTPLQVAKKKQSEHPEIYNKIVECLETQTAIKNYNDRLLNALNRKNQMLALRVLQEQSPAGWDINATPVKSNNMLNKATQRGHLNLVKQLVEKGALIRDGLYKTTLHEAAENNEIEIAKFLIGKSPDSVNAMYGANDTTPLMLAIKNKHVKMFKLLVEKNADLKFETYSPFSSVRLTKMTPLKMIEHEQTAQKEKGKETPELDQMMEYLLATPMITSHHQTTTNMPLPQTQLGIFSQPKINTTSPQKRVRENDGKTSDESNGNSSAKKQKSHLPSIIKIEDHEENSIRELNLNELWKVIKILRGNNNCQVNCVHLTLDLIHYFKTSKIPFQPSCQEFAEGFLDCTTTETQMRVKPENGYTSTTVPHHRTYFAITSAHYTPTTSMPLPTPFVPQITIQDSGAPQTEKIYLLNQEAVPGNVYTLDEVDDHLKREAQNNGGTSFGMLHHFTKSGKGTNHLLFYFSTAEQVTYIDIHLFNGETQTGNPIFDINGLKTNYLYYLKQIKTVREVTPETYDYRLAYLPFAPDFSRRKSSRHVVIKEENTNNSHDNPHSYHF
jgi:ankyrin repeat protein